MFGYHAVFAADLAEIGGALPPSMLLISLVLSVVVVQVRVVEAVSLRIDLDVTHVDTVLWVRVENWGAR